MQSTAQRRQLTAAHLSMLLGRRAAYRAQWVPLVEWLHGAEINQRAIGRVLERATGRNPGALKDRVHRALSGEALTAATLQLFIDAFQFTRADSARLWAMFNGRTGSGEPCPMCGHVPG